MMFRLMTHENPHGYSVSLVKYGVCDDPLSLEAGFTLNTFATEGERNKYLNDLAQMTGFEIERL